MSREAEVPRAMTQFPVPLPQVVTLCTSFMIFAECASYLNRLLIFFTQLTVTGALVKNASLVLRNVICKIR